MTKQRTGLSKSQGDAEAANELFKKITAIVAELHSRGISANCLTYVEASLIHSINGLMCVSTPLVAVREETEAELKLLKGIQEFVRLQRNRKG